MGLLNTLRHALRFNSPAPADRAAPDPAPFSLDHALRRQLLKHLAADFSGLHAVLGDEQIRLEPYGLLLETRVLERTPHPQAVVLALGFRLRHDHFFPEGIVECLAGVGEHDAEAVEKGVQNYLHSVLRVVLDALDGHHAPALDITGTGEVLWHPVLGAPQVQGAWAQRVEQVDPQHYLTLLHPRLAAKLTPAPFHWVKVYASRLPDGTFVGECLWDNAAWEEGLRLVEQDSAQWPRAEAFAGWKQVLLFRRCGA